MFSWIFSGEPPEPTELEQIMEQRGRMIMNNLCNAIEINPQSAHTLRLVEEYEECAPHMLPETQSEMRQMLLKVLNTQIEVLMSKEKWDENRLKCLKSWVNDIIVPCVDTV